MDLTVEVDEDISQEKGTRKGRIIFILDGRSHWSASKECRQKDGITGKDRGEPFLGQYKIIYHKNITSTEYDNE